MCGIAGVFAYLYSAPNPSIANLRKVRDRMSTRGPDGFGEWSSDGGRCLLAHRRLSIIDLDARANQPMLSSDGSLAITFNGEIYNYRDLIAELQQQGRTFRTTSDTEVLLQLYERDGPAMVERLRGMYTLAIWDSRRQGLFLARDPYGIKPLFYADDGWTFRFASQVKALTADLAVSREIDSAGAVGFMLFGSVPEPFTIHRAVRALPAGSSIWVDRTGVREPVFHANIAEALAKGGQTPRIAVDEAQALSRAALLDSVRSHLVADVEVGAFLSAGVDSGALVGLMRDAGQNRLRTVTLGFSEFKGTAEDETLLAAEMARRYGTDHQTRWVTPQEFAEDQPHILEAMDQPSIDGVNSWFVSKAARELGLKVAISGLGGDELFAGYDSFRDVPLWARLFGVPAQIPFLGLGIRKLMQASARGMLRRTPKAAGLLEYAKGYPGAYLVRRALFLPFELETVLSPDLVREGLRRLAPERRIAASLKPDPGSPITRLTALESSHYMRNQLLRDADWTGMAHSLEIRTPLVDWTLLNALAPLLPSLSAGEGKTLLANAPSLPLPAEIVARRKTGFGVPMGVWRTGAAPSAGGKGGESREWARDILSRWIAAAPAPTPSQPVAA